MAVEYADRGVKFAFVYTREAHPGESYGHITSLEQKLRHARDMVARDRIARPMLVDDRDGAVHRAYGRLPNMAVIVGGGGQLLYRAAWTDADNLALVLDRILDARGAQRAGAQMRPYYVEWQATVASDRQKFVEVLLETAGPRAVTEYIDAVAHQMGDGVAGPLRVWWETARPDESQGEAAATGRRPNPQRSR